MLKIIKITPEYLKNLHIKFDHKKLESAVSQYEIFKESGIHIQKDSLRKPLFSNNFYWSISHKKNLVFIGFGNTPIGIDIEKIKTRSKEVFNLHKENEYVLFGGKDIEIFYKLWTVKESIIKLHLSSIDYLNDIKINSIKHKNKIINEILFQYEVKSFFNEKESISYIGINDDIVYSLSYFK